MTHIVVIIILISGIGHGNSALNKKKDESKFENFRKILRQSKNVLIMTGPGISVESDVPVFEGGSRMYRHRDSHNITHPDTFEKSPSLVWEFYILQRELVLKAKPNKAHYAIAEFERECNSTNRNFTLVTQTIDELHRVAGSNNILELHGTMFKTRCTVCGDIQSNYENPVCSAFKNKSINRYSIRNTTEDIPVSELPRCKKTNCSGLLRPDTVWLSEPLDPVIIEKTEKAMELADVCLIIGSSSMVQPAANFPVTLAKKGIPVAEFNTWTTFNTQYFQFHFEGELTETVPRALKKLENDKTNTSNIITD